MADEPEETNFRFTPEGAPTGKSNRDYTGKGKAVYPNAEVYEGDYVEGVSYAILSIRKGMAKESTPMPIRISMREISSTI